ncbi:MAG: hypothetical protein IH598_13075 [Bacteroidales bacterium]|nr:hypothetical protein [Bacteroidales bacterium]
MKTSKTFLLFTVLLAIYSCEKEHTSSAPEITAGECRNMIVNYYDTTLAGGYHYPVTFNLDLDINGTDDIQFQSEIWGSPGMGQIPKSMIRCLHPSAKLLGVFTSDTLFLNRDTIVQEGLYPNTWEMYLIHNYTCNRVEDKDTVLAITPDFNIKPLQRGEIIRKSDAFNSDTVTLTQYFSHSYPMLVGVVGDTTIYEYNVHFNDCDTFPQETVAFIGVFMDNERLGWIKISIFDRYKIMIQESALQESGLIK